MSWKQSLDEPQKVDTAATLAGGRARPSAGEQPDAQTGWKEAVGMAPHTSPVPPELKASGPLGAAHGASRPSPASLREHSPSSADPGHKEGLGPELLARAARGSSAGPWVTGL